MIIISLFYCCGKVFILMKTWLIEKNVMKHHYLKKKNFTVTKEDIITDTDFENAKRFCKDFEIKKLGE